MRTQLNHQKDIFFNKIPIQNLTSMLYLPLNFHFHGTEASYHQLVYAKSKAAKEIRQLGSRLVMTRSFMR